MIESYANPSAVPAARGARSDDLSSSRVVQAVDTDAELMARVATEGDRTAFSHLVNRYKDPLVGYLARLVGCPERAQDLAQESFLRLFRFAGRYRDQGHFRAYLFRIATNLVRSQERRNRSWRKITGMLTSGAGSGEADPTRDDFAALEGGGAPAWWTGGESESAEGLTLQRECHRMLTRAIAALPFPYRSVLVLAEIEEIPHREIATLLGCREGTVKSRLHRARKKLREQLEPYWRGVSSTTDTEPRGEGRDR